MKKFTALFVFTILSAAQALKIHEKIGEQVREEVLLGAPPVQSVINDIQNVNASVQQYIQSANNTQQAINQTQQAINQLVQSIQNQNISFSTISQQLVTLNSNLSSSLFSSAPGSSNLINAPPITSQLAQLTTDYGNLVNGTYSGPIIVGLPGCKISGATLYNDRGWNQMSYQEALQYYNSWQKSLQFKIFADYQPQQSKVDLYSYYTQDNGNIQIFVQVILIQYFQWHQIQDPFSASRDCI